MEPIPDDNIKKLKSKTLKKKNTGFWKSYTTKEKVEFIAGIITILSIFFAGYSLLQSKKSIDLSVKTIKKSDSLELANRHNDSIRYIADTTYKGEVRRLQDKQQKLLGTLVDLTDKMIEEKIYSERSKIEVSDYFLSELDSEKQDAKYFYFSSDITVKNFGKRAAKNLIIKVYYSSEISKKIGCGVSNIYNVTQDRWFKITMHPFTEKNLKPPLIIYTYIQINWIDEDTNKPLSSEIMYYHSYYPKTGKFLMGIMSEKSLNHIKAEIFSKKSINLNGDTYHFQYKPFFPDFYIKWDEN
jgi:hypothetical protein